MKQQRHQLECIQGSSCWRYSTTAVAELESEVPVLTMKRSMESLPAHRLLEDWLVKQA